MNCSLGQTSLWPARIRACSLGQTSLWPARIRACSLGQTSLWPARIRACSLGQTSLWSARIRACSLGQTSLWSVISLCPKTSQIYNKPWMISIKRSLDTNTNKVRTVFVFNHSGVTQSNTPSVMYHLLKYPAFQRSMQSHDFLTPARYSTVLWGQGMG